MSEPTQISEVIGPGPNLAQIDPPHPFKSAFKTLVIAAIVVSLALGLYVYLGQRPPVAAGEVLQTTVYPVHTVINNSGGIAQEGMAGSSESYDQVLILTKIKIRNQTDINLFLQDISSAIKLPDGSEQENVAASDRDMDRVFQAYPSLSSLRAVDPSRHNPGSRPGRGRAGYLQLSPEQGTMGQAADGQRGGVVHAPKEPGSGYSPVIVCSAGWLIADDRGGFPAGSRCRLTEPQIAFDFS